MCVCAWDLHRVGDDAAQNLKAEVKGEVEKEEGPKAAGSDSAVEEGMAGGDTVAKRGRNGADKSVQLRTDETKLQLQQQEIDALEQVCTVCCRYLELGSVAHVSLSSACKRKQLASVRLVDVLGCSHA